MERASAGALLLVLAGCAGKKAATVAPDAGADSGVLLSPDGSASAPNDAAATGDSADDALAPPPQGDAFFPASDVPTPAADGPGPGDATADSLPMVADAGPDTSTVAGAPLDLYIMFDQSGSMVTKDDGMTTRLQVVRDALGDFLHAPGSNGLGVGIGFFGYHPLACGCTSCDPTDYATPTVTIGLLPQRAEQIASALASVVPTGETPTGPAIRGACRYASARRQLEPSRKVAILLVTDGEPQAPFTARTGLCNPTLADAVLAAEQCLSNGVRTYVLGVGPSLESLGEIAVAGGSSRAYLVSNGARMAILDMLVAIRADATP
jgi:hypothetical protein